jgi:hypothetical protein
MQEITREQEAAIARLAIDHASVAVAPQEDGTVKVTAASRTLILDEDGNAAPEPITHGYIRIPIETLRRLLGDERMAEMLAKAAESPYPEHALNSTFGAEMCEAIGAALEATRHDDSWLAAARTCALDGDMAGAVRCIDNVREQVTA